MRTRIGFVMIAAVLLAACSPAVPQETTVTPSGAGVSDGNATPAAGMTTEPGTAVFEPTPGGQPDSSQPVLVFSRSGGIAGIEEAWSIYADGTVKAADGSLHSLTQAEVEALVMQAGRLGFWEMAESFGMSDNCADCLRYTMTFSWDGQTKTVTTIDAASDAPAELNELLTTINNLVASAAGS